MRFKNLFGGNTDAQAALLAESLRLRQLSREIRLHREGSRADLRIGGKLAVLALVSAAVGLPSLITATAGGIAAFGIAAGVHNAVKAAIMEKEAAPLKERLFPSKSGQTVVNITLSKPGG